MSSHPYASSAPLPRALASARADERRRPGLAGPLGLAGFCMAAIALVWVVAELVPATHARDAVVLGHFVTLSSSAIDPIARLLPHLLNPLLFTIWAVALVLIAIARERPRVALAVASIMAIAPLCSEMLKPLLAHPHVRAGFTQIGPASFPSGHSTAAGILAMSAVLVSPPRLRPLVAVLAAGFALAVGAALLIRAWHMPSDVIAGYLMALLWASLAVAAVRWSERRRPSRRLAS